MAYTDIDKPTDYFNTKLYSGDGTSSNAISSVGFQPDWIWIKRRDVGAWHYLFDSIRGANKTLYSNLNSAETTDTNNLQSFDSDGFTVGTQADMNASGGTFASWNWLASNTTASNTDGSITSTVSANTTSGFSIVSYSGNSTSGATVGHGLGATPKIVIVKWRNSAGEWYVYSPYIGATNFLRLNANAASAAASSVWNNTDPNSTTFTLGNDGAVNGSGSNYIAYCFAEKKGFSRFGSYVGNGSNDGSYIHLGFKPAWVMIKRSSDGTDRWTILDNKRDSFNVSNTGVYADDSQAENSTTTEQGLDILSNGFKIRNSNTKTNTSGATYIYMAFASNPFVTSTGVQTTAR